MYIHSVTLPFKIKCCITTAKLFKNFPLFENKVQTITSQLPPSKRIRNSLPYWIMITMFIHMSEMKSRVHSNSLEIVLIWKNGGSFICLCVTQRMIILQTLRAVYERNISGTVTFGKDFMFSKNWIPFFACIHTEVQRCKL